MVFVVLIIKYNYAEPFAYTQSICNIRYEGDQVTSDNRYASLCEEIDYYIQWWNKSK